MSTTVICSLLSYNLQPETQVVAGNLCIILPLILKVIPTTHNIYGS